MLDPAAGQRPGAGTRAAGGVPDEQHGVVLHGQRVGRQPLAGGRRWWPSASRTIATVSTAPESTSSNGTHRASTVEPSTSTTRGSGASAGTPRRTQAARSAGRSAHRGVAVDEPAGRADPDRLAEGAVEPGLLVDLAHHRVGRVLPEVDASAREGPPLALGDPRRDPREQDVALADDDGVRRHPLPPRRAGYLRGGIHRCRRHGADSRRAARSRYRFSVVQAAVPAAPPTAAPVKRRDPWFDNAKMALIVLVVIGHSWTLLPHNTWDSWTYNFLYSWHIPAFGIVTGHFSKSFEWTRPRMWSLVTTVAVPYVISRPCWSGTGTPSAAWTSS